MFYWRSAPAQRLKTSDVSLVIIRQPAKSISAEDFKVSSSCMGIAEI